MRILPGLSLGAPGIYRFSEVAPRTIGGARMDVCAFVGVAPRGPARIPEEPEGGATLATLLDPDMPRRRSVAVAVESWDEYRNLYGGFDGPGRLPYAVALFFEQGGRRAYVVRIVHEYIPKDNPTEKQFAEGKNQNGKGVAEGFLPRVVSSSGAPKLRARNEGRWGNNLQASLGFSASPVILLPGTSATELVIDESNVFAPGSLLRLSLPVPEGTPPKKELCFIKSVRLQGEEQNDANIRRLILEKAASSVPMTAELIEGIFEVTDNVGQVEKWEGVGLSSNHPRWIGDILYRESKLVYPHKGLVLGYLCPEEPALVPFPPSFQVDSAVAEFAGGEDRYSDIESDDFFDNSWSPNDPDPGDGIQAVSKLSDLSSLVVPDLYVAEPLDEQLDIYDYTFPVSSSFEPCVEGEPDLEKPDEKEITLKNLRLDPLQPDELKIIIDLQKKLADYAEACTDFVVLLDVPPGLDQKKILQWRACFHSSYVAAYAPWLRTFRSEDGRNRLILLNPSAVAAGIIAAQELRFGVPHGPANIIANGVVKVDERISFADHGVLHQKGINIFLQERDGAWLSAGRTLSRDRRYRQLSVRRLMLMLRRTLQQEMQWVVFEPNSPALWRELRIMLSTYLRRLYALGAFQGASEEEAFFVCCDAELNSPQDLDAGRLRCEVGVAPAEPLEFIVFRITRSGDGTLTTGE